MAVRLLLRLKIGLLRHGVGRGGVGRKCGREGRADFSPLHSYAIDRVMAFAHMPPYTEDTVATVGVADVC